MNKRKEFVIKREYEGTQSVSEAFEGVFTTILMVQIKAYLKNKKGMGVSMIENE